MSQTNSQDESVGCLTLLGLGLLLLYSCDHNEQLKALRDKVDRLEQQQKSMPQKAGPQETDR